MRYDVIVAGLGAMGTAAADHLARRGQRVLGLEPFGLAHDRGSSHGLTRIIRLAYFEDPAYVPLLRRAFELWRELERDADETLLHAHGALDVGPEGSRVFEGSRLACREHGLRHEILDAAELERRFPGWRPAADARAVLQPDGGFLRPERCLAAHAARAAAAGADLHWSERLVEWRAENGRVSVRTDSGRYEAGQLVLAGGAWMGALAPSLARHLTPERQVLGWFAIADRPSFAAERFPVFVMDADEGQFYGFPEFEVPGFKIGKYHHLGQIADPDLLDRSCSPADEAALRAALARYFPGANGELLRSAPCMFTNTPDEHFVLDRDRESPEVVLVSACSGHGFKFASVVGEIVADLAISNATRHDIALFRASRFSRRSLSR